LSGLAGDAVLSSTGPHRGVTTITINRPARRNAINAAIIDRLGRALRAAEEDDSVHALVLTGAGDQAFSAGADLAGVEKLTVRERIDLLFDDGSFLEQGLLAHHQSQLPAMQGKFTPADGVVTGVGTIDRRRVALIGYDFTVMAGSIGMVGETKATRMRQLALRERIPIVWLVDSAGARIQEATGSMFTRTGDFFREQGVMSGVVPQVAAMMGPGAAGTAYIPGLADFVPMVKGTSNMALAGPHPESRLRHFQRISGQRRATTWSRRSESRSLRTSLRDGRFSMTSSIPPIHGEW
jgi:hypothetical protein